ncbi:hypothetical protein [Nocardia higoensis]|uniref:hypothetical protein n=1 Tax=Nocardia higoensis TaxID=228599 RepID=UPI0002E6D9CF|nr:hypothetical protein [Nocardia higoensis]
MSTSVLIALVVAVVAVVAALFLLVPRLRTRRLRRRFGPEYDRIVAAADDRAAAERELRRREHRHAELDLRPLPGERKRHYSAEWIAVQERFVDDPHGALKAADRLVAAVAAERGYLTGDNDQQLADLSVEHAAALEQYRNGREIAARTGEDGTSTEEIRTAFVGYRALFRDLLDAGDSKPETNVRTRTQPRTPAETATDVDIPTEKGALR